MCICVYVIDVVQKATTFVSGGSLAVELEAGKFFCL